MVGFKKSSWLPKIPFFASSSSPPSNSSSSSTTATATATAATAAAGDPYHHHESTIAGPKRVSTNLKYASLINLVQPTIGLKLLYAGVNPEFDIVAVHGLNGDAYRTWTWKGPKKDDKEVLWLRDLLPAEIQDARIFTYGYDSIPTGVMSGVSTKYIHQHAQTFLEDLWAQRRGNEIKRPIIFIAHSLGGILVKQALIISSQSHAQHNEKLRSIITSTYGIMFMGTPHTGSDLARWGSVAESIISRMIPKAIVDTNPNLIKTLGRNSEVLQNITSGFVSIQSKHFFKLYYFWEEMKTKLPNGSYEAVVEYSSAVPEAAANIQSYGMHEEHSKMCRFQNDQDSGYLVIVRALIDWRDAAPDAIRRKWQQYIESVRLDALHSIEAGNAAGAVKSIFDEMPSHQQQIRLEGRNSLYLDAGKAPLMLEGPSSLSSSLHESISDQQGQLVVQTPGTLLPSTVEPQFIVPHRPNEIFEGRRKELDELDQILKNSKKRRDGHASAVVSGISGSGKTHLIRQYVYEHRKEYPGGIFWIEAMSSATIGLGYWKIAMGLGLTTGTLGEPENTDQFVSLVLSWFRNNSKWLLVMDGADHETDEEIYSLKEVLPTGHDGAIIFTTVNHALAGTARLGSPEGLPLRDLEMDQCLAMLFKYARITNCTPEDKRDAEELVNGMDRLPLAIHSAGTYIKEMHIDIGRFLQYNKKHPRVDSLTSFHVILDQLEGRYPEAINLLYILSFVERKVPVRMLEWGIRHSQVALTAPDKKDAFGLSETISHLLSYSMVDRRSVVEIEDPGKVDMLFVHKVVQEICRQRMRADKALSYWLITCANLFCDSFRRMEQRRRDKYFSVSDYRRYQVHLLKINEHGRKYKIKSEDFEVVDEILTKVEEAISQCSSRVGSQSSQNGDVQEFFRPRSQFSGSWSSLDESGDSDSNDVPYSGEIIYVPDKYAHESPTEHYGYTYPVAFTPNPDVRAHQHSSNSPHSSPQLDPLSPRAGGGHVQVPGISASSSRTASPRRPSVSQQGGSPQAYPPPPIYYIPSPAPKQHGAGLGLRTSPQNSPPNTDFKRPYPPSPGEGFNNVPFPSAPHPPDRDYDDDGAFSTARPLPRNQSDPALTKRRGSTPQATFSRSQGDLTQGRGRASKAPSLGTGIVPLRATSRDSRAEFPAQPWVEPLTYPLEPSFSNDGSDTGGGGGRMARVLSEGGGGGSHGTTPPSRLSPKFPDPKLHLYRHSPPTSEPMSRSISPGSSAGGGVRLSMHHSEPMSRSGSRESVASTHSIPAQAGLGGAGSRYHKLSARHQTLPIPAISQSESSEKPAEVPPEQRKGYKTRPSRSGPGFYVASGEGSGAEEQDGGGGGVIEFTKTLPPEVVKGISAQEDMRHQVALSLLSGNGGGGGGGGAGPPLVGGLTPAEYLAASRRSSAPGAVQDPHFHSHGGRNTHAQQQHSAGAKVHGKPNAIPIQQGGGGRNRSGSGSGSGRFGSPPKFSSSSPPGSGAHHGTGSPPPTPPTAIFSRSPSPASIFESAEMQRSASEPAASAAAGVGWSFDAIPIPGGGGGPGRLTRGGAAGGGGGSLRKSRGASPLGKKGFSVASSPREMFLQLEEEEERGVEGEGEREGAGDSDYFEVEEGDEEEEGLVIGMGGGGGGGASGGDGGGRRRMERGR